MNRYGFENFLVLLRHVIEKLAIDWMTTTDECSNAVPKPTQQLTSQSGNGTFCMCYEQRSLFEYNDGIRRSILVE